MMQISDKTIALWMIAFVEAGNCDLLVHLSSISDTDFLVQRRFRFHSESNRDPWSGEDRKIFGEFKLENCSKDLALQSVRDANSILSKIMKVDIDEIVMTTQAEFFKTLQSKSWCFMKVLNKGRG